MLEHAFPDDNGGYRPAENFNLAYSDALAFDRLLIPRQELLAILENPDATDFGKPAIVFAVTSLIRGALIGAGVERADADRRANQIVHYGSGSFERARELAIKILRHALAGA